MTLNLPVKLHASLGASTAKRWMACPGSINLIESLAIPEGSGETEYAREGTAAHALAEMSLTRKLPPSTFVGTSLGGVKVTNEMAEHVSVFTEYCAALPGKESWVEKRFTLAALNPPAPMFGTCDYVAYDDEARVLEVVDLKFGVGVVVDAFENEQLLYYALGALLEFDKSETVQPDTIQITIVQPRAPHADGIIRGHRMGLEDVLGFANKLLDAARATREPDAPRLPGKHCRFCPASGMCPEQQATALAVAQDEFGIVPDVPPDPLALPEAVFIEMLPKLSILEEWIRAMYGRAEAKLNRGEVVKGFKLVARRANRSWVDENETVAWLEAKGIAREDYMKMELKSPAGVERIVGKKNLASDLTQKVSSGYTMVPESDARPAAGILPAGEEFTALTNGENV